LGLIADYFNNHQNHRDFPDMARRGYHYSQLLFSQSCSSSLDFPDNLEITTVTDTDL